MYHRTIKNKIVHMKKSAAGQTFLWNKMRRSQDLSNKMRRGPDFGLNFDG